VALPIVLFVGFLLTRPVRELKRDMEVVASGNLEHQSSLRSHDELGSLAAAFNRMTHKLADAQQAEIRRQALERELSIATQIQAALLPERVPELPHTELASHCLSAKEVGGDYYDFIPLAGGRLGIVIADVSGKGIPAGLVMTMTRSLVRMAAHVHERVGDLLAAVNASLSRDMTRGMFVTMTYIAYDPASGRIQLGRAGHDPAFLHQSAKGKIGTLQPGGMALGMDSGELFRQSLQVGELTLASGDFLVLYTDGVTEAMDRGGQVFGAERLVAVLERACAEGAAGIVEAVVRDVAAHTAGAEQSDDITMIVLKRGG
jgi:sigma-B regulation protein RsbU (phosphoserine phosphatase)